MKNYDYCETKHAHRRKNRIDFIHTIIGDGIVVDSFVVDNGHPNGEELHIIDSMGIITIFNNNSRKLVTKLIARPSQVTRYYISQHKEMPEEISCVILLCEEHAKRRYNQI